MFTKIINKFRKKKPDTLDEIWKNYQFPKVTRVYPTLVSNQIVNVQPMQAPPPGWQTKFTGSTITFRPKRSSYGQVGQKGTLITRDLVEDILRNWDNIEAILYDTPQINITLKRVPVMATTRKLKGTWTI